MRSRLLHVATLGVALLSIAVPTASVAGAAAAVSVNTKPSTVCYSQFGGPYGAPVVSQKFETSYAQYDSRAADDFTLSAPCSATSVDVSGGYLNGAGPALKIQVRFYKDSSTLPGAVIATRNVSNFTVGSGAVFHVPWANPVVLQAATTYWVSVRVRMDFIQGGEWGWGTFSNTIPIGNPAVWKNPNLGYTPACPNWKPLVICFGAASGDLMFTISS